MIDANEPARTLVGIAADKRLKQRSHELEGERDQTHLRKTQVITLLQERVGGRNDCLQEVVQQMRKTHSEQDRVNGSLYGRKRIRKCLHRTQSYGTVRKGLYPVNICWEKQAGSRIAAPFDYL
jgi:hypothetical protein